MRFQHRFQVQAAVEAVTEFHRRPEILRQITPPPVIMKVHRAPDRISRGDVMAFTLWLGPLPVFWESVFPEVGSDYFIDEQLRGPFRVWRHRHSFIPLGEGSTEVVDEIEAELRSHPWYFLVGLGMWLTLPLLFLYRQMRTRRILEGAG